MEVIDCGKGRPEDKSESKPVLGGVTPMQRSDMAAYLARAFQSDGAMILLINIGEDGAFRVRTGEHNLSNADAREALCLAISLSYADTTEVTENSIKPVVNKDELP